MMRMKILCQNLRIVLKIFLRKVHILNLFLERMDGRELMNIHIMMLAKILIKITYIILIWGTGNIGKVTLKA